MTDQRAIAVLCLTIKIENKTSQQILSYNAEIANKFVECLKRLFELADTSE